MQRAMIVALVGAVGTGLAIGTQATLNTWLGRLVGPIRTGLLVNFAGGILAGLLLLVLVVTGQLSLAGSLRSSPILIFVASGALGLGIIGGIAYSLPRTGIAAGVAAIFFGQMLVAVVVDSLGWGGAGAVPLKVGRLVGLGLLFAGTWLVLPRV